MNGLMVNLPLFISLIIIGIIASFFFIKTNKPIQKTTQQRMTIPIQLLGFPVVLLIYLFRLTLMVITGIVTNIDLILFSMVPLALVPLIVYTIPSLKDKLRGKKI